MAQNDEFIFALRNANPIETVISSYIQLKRRGRNYVCKFPKKMTVTANRQNGVHEFTK